MADFNTSSLMTLDEAIKHAEERASLSCDECAEQHRQLAEWLKELKQYREYFKGCRLAYAFKIGNVWPLETALKLTDLDINFAPQSFIYLEKDNPKQFALVKQLIRSEKVY